MTNIVKSHDQVAVSSRPPGVPAREERPNVGKLLAGPYFQLVDTLHRRLAEGGFGDVRPAHGTVFQVIEEEGTRVTELAARAGITKQAMTELVVHLERAGYLERAPDPHDRRARLVRLTRRGWECIAYARDCIAGIEAEWAALVGAARLAEVKDALGELNAALAVEPSWPRATPRAAPAQSRSTPSG
jgi:DNA-binding MarR family transcriptional regulator